jgi:hypothetical protein
MEAFLYLDERRQVTVIVGMGGASAIVQHIPVTEIDAYVRLRGWDRDRMRTRELLHYLGVLDEVAVEYHQAQVARRTPTVNE